MDSLEINKHIKQLSESTNWRTLLTLIDEGYKGMYVILRLVQESNNHIVAGELAKLMNVSTARIARALNTLENKKFIIRIKDNSDARKVIISLTNEGEKALIKRNAQVADIIGPMFNQLTKDEINNLFFLLKKLLS